MRLLELKRPNIIVVYGGGFQPFHEGHMSSYRQAKAAFPGASFFVAASNVTTERPFEFREKQFLAQQAGVRDPFVQVGTMSYVNDNGRKVTSTPLNPLEVLQHFNPERDVLVIVRSERDPMKTTGTSYYQPWTGIESAEPFNKHAYIYVTKKHDFTIAGNPVYSGSQVRELYSGADDDTKVQILQDLYPKAANLKRIKQIFDKRLAGVSEASLATMRDYFAGNKDARDELEITKQRKYYDELKKKEAELAKKFPNQQKKVHPITNRIIKFEDLDPDVEAENLLEFLRKIHKRWAIVSKRGGKPLVYFKGDGKPSEDWVERQERRIRKHKKK